MKKTFINFAAWVARWMPSSFKRWLYRQPSLARFIRRALNAAAPLGLNEIRVAAGILAGWRIELDLQTEKDYWLGTYEPDLQRTARDFIRDGTVVADVGANIGYISLIAARLSGASGRVYAFEALPANIERLQRNVALNGLGQRIIITQAAVMDRVGEAVFLAHASGAMGKAEGSAGRNEDYSQRIRVPALTLDHFFIDLSHPHPQVVKMDIEGGEGLALIGMHRLLTEIRPILLIELHGEQAARQAWDLLSAHSYRLCAMRPAYPSVESVETLDWKAYVVALPEEMDPTHQQLNTKLAGFTAGRAQ